MRRINGAAASRRASGELRLASFRQSRGLWPHLFEPIPSAPCQCSNVGSRFSLRADG